jgi:hypothetical protein
MRAMATVYQPFRECNSDELRIAPASQQLTRVGMELRMVSPDLTPRSHDL